jgi:acetyl-CoA carboxylase biotin carboxylase subunit
VRVDTHLFAGAKIPPYYDSMVAKILTHGEDRDEAIARMRRALNEFSLSGAKTTVPLLLEILDDPEFLSGKYDTGLLERRAKRASTGEGAPPSSEELARA